MNYPKKHADFKPYTTRDYERFKKNYGFGTGHLGFDSENTSFKEKVCKCCLRTLNLIDLFSYRWKERLKLKTMLNILKQEIGKYYLMLIIVHYPRHTHQQMKLKH